MSHGLALFIFASFAWSLGHAEPVSPSSPRGAAMLVKKGLNSSVARRLLDDDASWWCTERCRDQTFLCNDLAQRDYGKDLGWTISSNQHLSCAAACLIRVRGSSRDECRSQCSPETCKVEINGYKYDTCARCSDVDRKSPEFSKPGPNQWGVGNEQPCHAGCDMQSPAAEEYVRLATGSCPADRQVSKEECLAAAKSIGAAGAKTHLDGGDDAGLRGRPQGCTLHDWGAVEWWGPSDNAACGSLSYSCVCKIPQSRRLAHDELNMSTNPAVVLV